MKHQIRDLREQLAAIIEYEALTSEKAINISHMLDELIVEYTKAFSGKAACKLDELKPDSIPSIK